jgi:hypothetical protein
VFQHLRAGGAPTTLYALFMNGGYVEEAEAWRDRLIRAVAGSPAQIQRRHFTHSKMMAWVALDRTISTVEQFGLDGPLAVWRRPARRGIRSPLSTLPWELPPGHLAHLPRQHGSKSLSRAGPGRRPSPGLSGQVSGAASLLLEKLRGWRRERSNPRP